MSTPHVDPATASAEALVFDAPPSLTDAIARHVSAAIMEGRLKPGERLRETQLCRELQVSRSPVREALRVLAAEGLVVHLPRRGAHVAELTAKSVADVYAVRTLLDCEAARLAAASAAPGDVTDLRALNGEMHRAVEAGDAARFFALNTVFHERIARLSGNEYLASLQHLAAARTFRTLFLTGSNLEHLHESALAHDALLEALERGDGAVAEQVMRAHLQAGHREAQRVLALGEPGADGSRDGKAGAGSDIERGRAKEER